MHYKQFWVIQARQRDLKKKLFYGKLVTKDER